MLIHDGLLRHPKVRKAAARLDGHSQSSTGASGTSTVIHLFLWGIAYARQHLTDGFIPRQELENSAPVQNQFAVASAMSARGIWLWRKVKGGYRINDYHQFNPTASREKTRREQQRQYMARYRKAKARES